MSNTVLRIDASVATEGSVSRAALDRLVADIAPKSVIHRDLTAQPLPQITDAWAKARLVPASDRTEEERKTLALSDALITELQEVDTVLIGLPVYNFGMPAALKAWVDLVARPKVTFAYTPEGPKGLLTGKRAIVAMASGGTKLGSPGDFASPHLAHVLRFLGITDVTVLDAATLVTAEAA